jgi:hypothetical protein
MKFLFLIYYDENKLKTMPEDERTALYAEAYAHYDRLAGQGHALSGDPLDWSENASTVRIQGGKASVTDGPYVETKEQLGGYILVEARDMDEAVSLAGEVPPARLGGVEVRQIRPMRQ